MGAGTKLFISHSNDDHEVAAKICECIEARGVKCWIAPRDVAGGSNYAQVIEKEVHAAGAVLVVVSKNALLSRGVLREVVLGDTADKQFFIVRVDTTTITAGSGLGYFLAGIQEVHFDPEGKLFQDLATDIASLLKPSVPLPSPSPLPPPPASSSTAIAPVTPKLAPASVVPSTKDRFPVEHLHPAVRGCVEAARQSAAIDLSILSLAGVAIGALAGPLGFVGLIGGLGMMLANDSLRSRALNGVIGVRTPEGVYRGEKVGDVAEGFGVFVFTDGSRFEGQFASGARSGLGAQWSATGEDCQAGIWKDGALVKALKGHSPDKPSS